VSAWAQSTLFAKGHNPLHRVLFSIGSLTLTVKVASLPLALMMGTDAASLATLVRTAAVVAPLYFFINTALVAGAIGLSTRQPVPRVWQRNFLWSAPSYLAGAALAAFATAASARGWFGGSRCWPCRSTWSSGVTTPSSGVSAKSRRRHTARWKCSSRPSKRLRSAIEAKAGCTPEHIRSIQHYAATLAEASGLSDGEVQAVRMAALLHDIGNMAVPEHILAKPEALTPEEFERVKIHTRVGAEILRDVRSPRR